MANLLLQYAHPGQKFSRANHEMWRAAQGVDGIACRDLYATYPRFDVDIDGEQQMLLEHDIVLFQFPLFWYSTPSLVKEWIDLVLEHGFAYGKGGDRLAGKTMMLALTAAGPEDAYTELGFQHYPLRTFLTPLERTAALCQMRFAAPYVLYGSLSISAEGITEHANRYGRLLSALRDERYKFDAADELGVVKHTDLATLIEAN